MMRALGTILTFIFALWLPWQCAAVLAISVSLFEPLVPLAAGIFMDCLYYAPGSGLPLFCIGGLTATILSYLVRSQLKTSIIGG
jgi:hypothetical protein